MHCVGLSSKCMCTGTCMAGSSCRGPGSRLTGALLSAGSRKASSLPSLTLKRNLYNMPLVFLFCFLVEHVDFLLIKLLFYDTGIGQKKVVGLIPNPLPVWVLYKCSNFSLTKNVSLFGRHHYKQLLHRYRVLNKTISHSRITLIFKKKFH